MSGCEISGVGDVDVGGCESHRELLSREWDLMEQQCSVTSRRVSCPDWQQDFLVNVGKRIVPNRPLLEVGDLVPEKPDVRSEYWNDAVEVKEDVVEGVHQEGMVEGHCNIASIDVQDFQDEQGRQSKSLQWRWVRRYPNNVPKCAIEHVHHG